MSALLELNDIKNEAEPQPFRWNIEAYYEMAARGLFDNCRVELIEGEIVKKGAKRPPFCVALYKTHEHLISIFSSDFLVRNQLPMQLSHCTEVEPSLLIVRGSGDDFESLHPTTAALIIEISDSTLRYDRTVKSGLYARAGVAEYWILNVQARQLETFRAPIEDGDARFGWRYSETKTYGENEEVAPLESQQQKVLVAALLPRAQ